MVYIPWIFSCLICPRRGSSRSWQAGNANKRRQHRDQQKPSLQSENQKHSGHRNLLDNNCSTPAKHRKNCDPPPLMPTRSNRKPRLPISISITAKCPNTLSRMMSEEAEQRVRAFTMPSNKVPSPQHQWRQCKEPELPAYPGAASSTQEVQWRLRGKLELTHSPSSNEAILPCWSSIRDSQLTRRVKHDPSLRIQYKNVQISTTCQIKNHEYLKANTNKR